ncbi:MAG: FHA domain-containing protein [Eubacterium sp.]|nr:FHA domain-containing protein [Eubacterium sp.]
MRSFRFTAKNIGHERYLTYIMGEGMDVDEDVLDYCEENDIPEIMTIIYEEDDDFDYLTYDVTGRTSLEDYIKNVMGKEKVLNILRNVAMGMINIKEYAIPMSYIILNRSFMYIDPDNMALRFMYLPVEGDASVSMEFKSFARQLIASMKFDVEENLSYVGQLLTYINGDSFNLRGLIGLTEALMQDSGIGFGGMADIKSDDGSEIVDSMDPSLVASEEKNAADFMSGLEEVGDSLPEIGGDEEDEALEAAESAAVDTPVIDEEKAENAAGDMEADSSEDIPSDSSGTKEKDKTQDVATDINTEQVVPSGTDALKSDSVDDIKARISEIVGDKSINPKNSGVSMSKPVRVNKAAVMKASAEISHEEEAAAAAAAAAAVDQAVEAISSESRNSKEKNNVVTESASDVKKESALAPAKKEAVIDNTILGNAGTIKINPYLIRVNTGQRIMINKPVFKIGKASRGVDFHVSGNGAVSRQHAIILHKGDSYYIKDNKSTNHTYVDGKEIEPDVEVLLKDNSVISLGDEDFTFKVG